MSRQAQTSRLLAEQHSLPLTIALHLVPGVVIVATYLLIASPLVTALNFPPHLGWVVAMCIGLAPVQLGFLLYLGKRQTGRFTLRGVIGYRDKPTPRGPLILLVIALIVGVYAVSMALTPVDTAVYQALSSWIPIENSTTSFLKGYSRSTVITTLAVSLVLTGVILPAVEEFYFRGFLLPRMSRLGGWAPVANATLFSLYHFWTPWQFLSRVGFFLPTIWVTWRKKDLRISLWVHCAGNTLLQAATLTAVVLGFA
ncbi:lysostaphin resistance A-like protein [Spongiactinospora sp. 9N601]|uniref:lysostaphin resistance A-like protein n=1 Tax=Spongiactinospora sp. 9N601 TaxID=3375149 RepID=UPI0037896FA3